MEGIEKIQLEPEHWEAMLSHILETLPNEACGLLGGIGENVRVVIPVTNELRSPVRFRMDPSEQLTAMQRIEAMGFEMIGIFHSHVRGPEGPSRTDQEQAYYPNVAYLIWSSFEDEWICRSFRLIEGSTNEIPLVILSE
jgi:proteasome lid subunit RPN8/RPN11